jgi:tripartite-type tricarboxylate transporter receptor subunit TctC
VTSARRSPVLPEVPTVQEGGLPGYEVTGWYGVLAPAGTPQPILSKIHRDVVLALKTPQVSGRLRDDGAEAVGSSPAEFVDFIKVESAKWAGVVKALNIKAD